MSENKELNLEELGSVAGGDEKPKKWVTYTTPGEYLRDIASRYMVTVSELKKWNNLTSNYAEAGTTLMIYTINY